MGPRHVSHPNRPPAPAHLELPCVSLPVGGGHGEDATAGSSVSWTRPSGLLGPTLPLGRTLFPALSGWPLGTALEWYGIETT